jgi:protein FAM50
MKRTILRKSSRDVADLRRKKRDASPSSSDAPKKRLSKNPDVDTSFLPDRYREEEERLHREDLRKKWLAEQERIKNETIEIVYSFWDGSGHRKTVECLKGDDIAAFLGKCRAQFPELRATSIDNMMYIKVSHGRKALMAGGSHHTPRMSGGRLR